MKSLKIGLVGENRSDAQAVALLLDKMIEEDCEFRHLFKNATGSMLDQAGGANRLRRDYELFGPDIVVFIRDLDAFETDKHALNLRKAFFQKKNRTVDGKGMFLLNIWEIEALILADIHCFNQIFNVEAPQHDDVMLIPEPKEYLQSFAKYREAHCGKVLESARVETLSQNCRYFARFRESLDIRLATIRP